MKNHTIILLFLAIVSCQTPRNLVVDNFEKPKENPILQADSAYTFLEPKIHF